MHHALHLSHLILPTSEAQESVQDSQPSAEHPGVGRRARPDCCLAKRAHVAPYVTSLFRTPSCCSSKQSSTACSSSVVRRVVTAICSGKAMCRTALVSHGTSKSMNKKIWVVDWCSLHHHTLMLTDSVGVTREVRARMSLYWSWTHRPQIASLQLTTVRPLKCDRMFCFEIITPTTTLLVQVCAVMLWSLCVMTWQALSQREYDEWISGFQHAVSDALNAEIVAPVCALNLPQLHPTHHRATSKMKSAWTTSRLCCRRSLATARVPTAVCTSHHIISHHITPRRRRRP